MTEDELLDRFRRGLKIDLQRELLKDNPHTLQNAIMIAERVEEAINLSMGMATPSKSYSPSSSPSNFPEFRAPESPVDPMIVDANALRFRYPKKQFHRQYSNLKKDN